MKVRFRNKLESFVMCAEPLWPDCGGPSLFSHPTPSKAAKPPKPIPFRFRPKLRQKSTSKNLFSSLQEISKGGARHPRGPGQEGAAVRTGQAQQGILSTRPAWPGLSPPLVPGHAAVKGTTAKFRELTCSRTSTGPEENVFRYRPIMGATGRRASDLTRLVPSRSKGLSAAPPPPPPRPPRQGNRAFSTRGKPPKPSTLGCSPL